MALTDVEGGVHGGLLVVVGLLMRGSLALGLGSSVSGGVRVRLLGGTGGGCLVED